jgi:two-component system chemotaxis sensor kinase CheA
MSLEREFRCASMDNQREIIEEFLVESNESLAQLDQDFVALEARPHDHELLSSIFRAIHTIKGVSGFLGFSTLGAVTHGAENILSQLRDGERMLNRELTDLLLETFDAVKRILAEIEKTSEEGADDRKQLVARLEKAGNAAATASETPAPQITPPIPATALDEFGQEPDEQPTRATVAESNIRVSVEALDDLMNLVGELVLARNQILQFTTTQQDAALLATSQRLNLITTELQAKVMKTRMQPIRVVWNKFPRIVRDLGKAFGKQIELVMEGAGTELDKTVLEAIKAPLTHIVRNSCDHGIETTERRTAAGKAAKGRLLLCAYHEGGQVNIEISDDGGGVDTDRVKEKALAKGLATPERVERMSEAELANLVFLPGLSTAETVTGVSGRGVGMDVVKRNIEKLRGKIEISSEVGRGSVFKIKLPLTMAIIDGLVVRVGEDRFILPSTSVQMALRPTREAISTVHGRGEVLDLRGRFVPIHRLHQRFGITADAANPWDGIIVIVETSGKTSALLVDEMISKQEVVIKNLGAFMQNLPGVSGGAILGDGNIALILDPGTLLTAA